MKLPSKKLPRKVSLPSSSVVTVADVVGVTGGRCRRSDASSARMHPVLVLTPNGGVDGSGVRREPWETVGVKLGVGGGGNGGSVGVGVPGSVVGAAAWIDQTGGGVPPNGGMDGSGVRREPSETVGVELGVGGGGNGGSVGVGVTGSVVGAAARMDQTVGGVPPNGGMDESGVRNEPSETVGVELGAGGVGNAGSVGVGGTGSVVGAAARMHPTSENQKQTYTLVQYNLYCFQHLLLCFSHILCCVKRRTSVT